MSSFKRKIYIHAGLPKTGTSTFQERLFPLSRYFFLGKENKPIAAMIKSQDPYLFVKSLCIRDMALSARRQKVKKFVEADLNVDALRFRDVLMARIGSSKEVIISDEGFTLQPLKYHYFTYLVPLAKGVKGSLSIEDCFRIGRRLAVRLSSSADPIRSRLICVTSLADVVQKCLEAFDAELGKVFVVDRDFGSWFVSFYLQCFHGALKSKRPPKEKFYGVKSLMILAGFIWSWDKYLQTIGLPGYATASGFCESVDNKFGVGASVSAKYSSSPELYAHSLVQPLSEFGLERKDVLSIITSSRVNDSANKLRPNEGIEEILSCKKELVRLINEMCVA